MKEKKNAEAEPLQAASTLLVFSRQRVLLPLSVYWSVSLFSKGQSAPPTHATRDGISPRSPAPSLDWEVTDIVQRTIKLTGRVRELSCLKRASSHCRLSLSLKSDFKRRHNWQCATCENVECSFVCLLLLFLWMLEARTSGSVLTHCSWKFDQPSLGDCYQFQCKPYKVCLQLDTRAVPLFIPIHLHCRVPQTQVSSKN